MPANRVIKRWREYAGVRLKAKLDQINDQLMQCLQEAFDAGYGILPRTLQPHAVEPLLVGHRGVFGHPDLRENTFEAFDLAVSCGGALEMDLRLTADDQVVIHHDPDLKRVHGVDAELGRLSLADLRAVAPAVPTLEEVLLRYREAVPRLFLEVKVYQPEDELERLVAALGGLLRQYGMHDRVTLLSLDPRPLDVIRRLLPDVSRIYVFGHDPGKAARYVRRHLDTGLAGWYFTFPGSLRPLLTEHGLHAGVGFINHANTMTALRNKGFSFHFTDRIDRLVAS